MTDMEITKSGDTPAILFQCPECHTNADVKPTHNYCHHCGTPIAADDADEADEDGGDDINHVWLKEKGIWVKETDTDGEDDGQ